MRYSRFPVLRYAMPAAAFGLGVMLFLPGGDGVSPQTTTAALVQEGARPSYLAAAPELIAELDAALRSRPSLVGETMAREAALPDPTATATQPVAAVPEVATTESAPEVEAANVIHVGGTAVNLRAGPSKSTARLATLKPGEPLTYGEESNGWVQVTTASGETGWVYHRYLAGMPNSGNNDDSVEREETQVATRQVKETAEEKPRFARHARITSNVVVRDGPSRSAQRLFVLPRGERVGIAEVDGRWARIVLSSGASGWVLIR